MRHSEPTQFIRSLALFFIAAAALLSLIPGRGGSPKTARSTISLDLNPNITRGLDLVCKDAPPEEAHSRSDERCEELSSQPHIGVFDGSEVMPMTLEDYLIGVTAAEMPASYGIEALKAQAVAARTFTLKHMSGELRCKSGHTICTDHRCCQAYISVERMKRNWGEDFEAYYNKVRDAVVSTDGLALTSEGELVTALYHSSSGGKTEDCEAVFAVALPYLVSVESGGEESSPEFKSTVRYTKSEFIEKINAAFPDALMSDPEKDVDVWKRTDSGRISLIRLGGTVVSGQQLRNALSLKSTNIEFDIKEDSVEICCLGFGHGVGMSQCGANAMAKKGADFEEILKHYYTGVEIEKVEPDTSIIGILCGAAG